MMNLEFPACALSTALLLLSPAAQALNLVSNGDFEILPFSSWPYYSYLRDGDRTTIPGWTAIDDGIAEPAYIFNRGGYTAVVQGDNSIYMNQGAGLETKVPLVAGQSYVLSFYAKWLSNLPVDPLEVTVGTVSRRFPVLVGYTSMTFTASAADPAALLRFYNPSPSGNYRSYVFDDVSLVATTVPEPATLALAALGLAGLAIPAIRAAGRRWA